MDRQRHDPQAERQRLQAEVDEAPTEHLEPAREPGKALEGANILGPDLRLHACLELVQRCTERL